MAILAVESPTFQPAMRIIDLITNGNPTIIITSFPHDYVTGEIVRIVIPRTPFNSIGWGMAQIDNLTGTITVTGEDTFTINIDSTRFDTFHEGFALTADQFCQVVPIGEINEILTAATVNVLP